MKTCFGTLVSTVLMRKVSIAQICILAIKNWNELYNWAESDEN